MEETVLKWRSNTPTLFEEIIEGNEKNWIFKQPLKILLNILGEVGQRANELQDAKLISLCMRLGILAIARRDLPTYDSQYVNMFIEHVDNPNKPFEYKAFKKDSNLGWVEKPRKEVWSLAKDYLAEDDTVFRIEEFEIILKPRKPNMSRVVKIDFKKDDKVKYRIYCTYRECKEKFDSLGYDV